MADIDDLQERARAALAGTRLARLRWVERTGSTNADLLARARGGAPEGEVLLADEQTAGRGRRGRSWSAPAGSSLLCSILLRPPLAPADAHLATTAVGLAARAAVAEVAGFTPLLKWPNDLVVDVAGPDGGTRKLAGVLAEAELAGDRLAALVVGIGLNVDWPPELPDDLAAIATACNHVAGRSVDRVDLVVALLRHLDADLPRLEGARGRAELAERYAAACATVGRDVHVDLGDGTELDGRAVGITPSGHLVVEAPAPGGGTAQREVAVGDVHHLRHHPG